MPKKFKGENSKAVEAKQRKADQVQSQKEHEAKAKEELLWQDDCKSVAKKKERKEETELRRLEQLEKKRERQKLVEEEESQLKSGKTTAAPAKKMTRDQINEMMRLNREKAAEKPAGPPPEDLLIENVNRVSLEGETASTISEAIQVMGNAEVVADKHPEKRMKAAYEEFESERLPELKAENPSLRLSQLKQMLRKEWMKHPENPINQAFKRG